MSLALCMQRNYTMCATIDTECEKNVKWCTPPADHESHIFACLAFSRAHRIIAWLLQQQCNACHPSVSFMCEDLNLQCKRAVCSPFSQSVCADVEQRTPLTVNLPCHPRSPTFTLLIPSASTARTIALASRRICGRLCRVSSVRVPVPGGDRGTRHG
jgi:hypothetical protein